MAVLCLFLLLFVFMFLGVPIAISLGLSGAVSILMFSQDSVSSLAIKLFETSDAYTFLAIPFFLLSGAFMTTGGVAQRLIDFANACVGHIRGGLAIAAVLACMLFAALSGSSPATVAAVYSAFVALFVYKDMKLRDCPKVLLESGRLAIMLMFIIANAMLFAHVLTTEQIPQEITAWVISEGLTPIGFLIMVNVVLLVAGSFMEPSAIVLILAPIFFPIAMKLGIDPIHLGIVMVVNMEIGLVHPPVGLNLFVTSAVTGLTLGQTIRAALPWLMILLVFLIMVTYLPFISLALPHWLGM
ncbi:TRAP transporter large permease [Pseudomonas sp. MAFF 301514]|uniref:TRAP transporter large permease n=1 Tax=Pseudomonas allii TaxID=2740531 RepID=UPI0015C17A25|nr:TRAP transporter large permease [Pseudomonas allii]NWN47642.1 TRAP transporter large permease [Pseudomonas allii]